MRVKRVLAALLVCAGATAGLGASCASKRETPAAERAPRPDARLVVLTDLDGKLEPCGCTSRPLGGVDRLVEAVERLRAEGVPTAVVAAGDVWHGDAHDERGVGGDAARTVAAWRAETLARALGQAGLAAAAPGAHDLAAGDLAALAALAGDAAVLGEGRRALVLPLGALRVGVVGLRPEEPDPLAAARLALGELPPVDRVVVLAPGGRQQAARVAREVERVDFVVVAGLDRAGALPPGAFGDAFVLHASREGQGFVVLDLWKAPPAAEGARPAPLRDASAWSREVDRKRLDERLEGLEARLASEPGSDELRRRIDEAKAERARLDARAPQPGPGAFAARFVELDPDVARSDAAAALLEAFAKRVNEHNRVAYADRAPPPPAPGEAVYAGSESCGGSGCHDAALAWWRTTPHGRAYETLVRDDKQFHLDCVGCHVTGYERPGGATVTHLGPGGVLKDVGCESCHGPGSLHNERPEEVDLVAETPERVCTACHNEEHSDLFVYEGYRAMLLAPGHGLPLPEPTAEGAGGGPSAAAAPAAAGDAPTP